MKILRVRLSNLASLQGEAEVDFEGPVLGKSPVYAITGRTGSGKSTLLDAICLALYGKTPRYDAKRSTAAEVGDVRDDDERNILRRGAGKGWAEVDFLGRDGRRYRARWEVRRAGEKAAGNLQPAKKNLYRVVMAGGQEIPEHVAERSEATEAVRQKLGLSFDQFRHAVMLAQGEFKAFLDAGKEERSGLLETITGTDIYSRLSIAAHKRKAEAESSLKELEQTAVGIQIMEDGERARLEAELAAIRKNEAALSEQQSNLQKWLDWFRAEEQKAGALEEAERERATTEEAIRQKEEDFAKLKDWEALDPVRSAWERKQGLDSDLANAKQRTQQLDGQRQAQAEEKERLTTAEAEARQSMEEARKALEEARPELDKARRLDQQCTQAEGLTTRAGQAAADGEGRLTQSTAALAELDRMLKERQEAIERDQQWLSEREPIRPVLENHEIYRRRLEELEGLGLELERKGEELERLRKEEADGRTDCEAAEQENARATMSREACRTELEQKRESVRALAPDTLREQARILQEQIGVLEGAVRIEGELAQEQKSLSEIERDIAANTEKMVQANGEALERERARQTVEQEAGAIRQTLDRLNRALASDLEALRAELSEGQPCPLCGSAHHPLAERAAMTSLNEELRAMRTRLEEMEAEVERLTAEEQRQRGLVTTAEGALGPLQNQQKQLRIRIGERQEELARSRSASNDSRPFAEQLEAARKARDAALGSLDQVRELESESAALQTRYDKETGQVEKSGTILVALEKKRIELSLRGDRLSEAVDEGSIQREALAKELQTTLAPRPEWAAAIGVNIQGLRASLNEESESYKETRQHLDQIQGALQDLVKQRAGEEARQKELEKQLLQANEELTQRARELEEVRGQRGGVLGGKPAEEVETSLAGRVKMTQTALDAAQNYLVEARQRLDQLDGTLRQLGEHVAHVQSEWERAHAEVVQFSERVNFALEKIGQILGTGNDWLEAVRQQREELTRDRENRRGQEEALRKQLEDHRAARPPLAREECEKKIAALDEESKGLDGKRDGLVQQLGIDSDNRERLGQARERLKEAREEARVWQSLGEAIGSADGKKFRAYAQGLTLRALVAYANAHLRQLRPRYRLRQNENSAMDLVLVDNDMGGEVRTVRSLSGGESFLVSLALALGLSNMAARDLSIDSLFIDEGFGTLDADTLQMALSVLQGLHAQGKQVGIISHVEGIGQTLGAEVRVETIEPGRSKIVVCTAC